MAGPTGLKQQHLVARVCRQPVRDGRTSRTGADNNVIAGLHALLRALSLDALNQTLRQRAIKTANSCQTNASSSLRSCSGMRGCRAKSKAASVFKTYVFGHVVARLSRANNCALLGYRLLLTD